MPRNGEPHESSRSKLLDIDHRRWLPPAIFAVIAFIAVLPLILQGCSCGHDFNFHLLNWMEAASQWQHGVLKPVWGFSAAFNAGEPRLLLYPPLSWAIGGALGMVLPWPGVPIVYTWLVLFLSGLAMHRLLQRWVTPAVATLGACLYLANPYMLFCAYERTAYAELLAAAWMPLLLAAMLRTPISRWRIMLVVALLWITNAPAAIIGTYSILLLGLARLFIIRRQGPRAVLSTAWSITMAVGVGLLVDAFYLLPMAIERKLVQLSLAVVPLFTPDANFLFAIDNDAFHDHVLRQVSWIATGTFSIALVCGLALLFSMRRDATVHPQHSMRSRDLVRRFQVDGRYAAYVLTALAAFFWFLLSRWSSRLWHLGPELTFLQFPWRFLCIGSAISVVLAMLLLQRGLARPRPIAIVAVSMLIAAATGYFVGGGYFRQECDQDETVQSQRRDFLNGDSEPPTDEYTPQDADNDALGTNLPPTWIAHRLPEQPASAATQFRTYRSYEMPPFRTDTVSGPAWLIVRLRAFRGWHAFRDGVEVTPDVRDDGLVAVPLPPGGAHTVEVRYRTTADQWAGMGVSAATLAALGAIRLRRRSVMMKHPA